jgi:general secretion pathway protein E
MSEIAKDRAWKRLGELLREEFSIAAEVIELGLEEQQSSGRRLGEILLGKKAVKPAVLASALARQADLPYLETIPEDSGDIELLQLVPIGFAKEYGIFPLDRHNGLLRLAVADPYDSRPVNDLAALTGLRLELAVAAPEEVLRAINRAYEKQAGSNAELAPELETDGTELADNLEPADLLDTSDEAPIIRFVNSLITKAYKERASDIHLEPFEKELLVRFRIDGILYEIMDLMIKTHASIISRIKIMSGLNIAEKRLPQDGRFRVRIAGKDLDVRVSSLPTAFGERVVLRLLDKSSSVLGLEQIGFEPKLQAQVEQMIAKSHGIFLVTGPTGSGKTTTLYAGLSKLNTREKNIITVEDPIEYQLAGVGQIQVNPKIDLTFANGLRSILRQDPDIIMVGEIRDGETAEIAVQSALTGHMVFSTLHTNDSAGALTRLVEMGIEPFLAASSIVGILAQRLVRRICPSCKEPEQPSAELLAELGLDPAQAKQAVFYRGRGCSACFDIGYRGRSGIYELLTMDDQIRDLLMQNKDAASIKTAAVKAGMRSLRQAGLAKALQGETTLEEVLRVTQEES